MAGQSAKQLSRKKGTQYEALACEFLLDNGLVLLTKNFSCRLGEIDLIMLDQTCLVFIEVRYRSASRFASAAHSVDARKQAKIARTAAMFLGQNPGLSDHPARFDVVAFDRTRQAQCTVQWIKSAFQVS